MSRFVVSVLCLSFLGGCALPPAVTLASLAIDGVSYAATGKTTTEHGLSLVTQEDCVFLRAVEDGVDELCMSESELRFFAAAKASEAWDDDPWSEPMREDLARGRANAGQVARTDEEVSDLSETTADADPASSASSLRQERFMVRVEREDL